MKSGKMIRIEQDITQAKASIYTLFNTLVSTNDPLKLDLNELHRMASKVQSITEEVQKTCSIKADAIKPESWVRKASFVAFSVSDSVLALTGGVLLFVGHPATLAIGSICIVASQAFSKSTDLASLCRKDRTQEKAQYLSLKNAAEIIINSTKNVQKLIEKYQEVQEKREGESLKIQIAKKQAKQKGKPLQKLPVLTEEPKDPTQVEVPMPKEEQLITQQKSVLTSLKEYLYA